MRRKGGVRRTVARLLESGGWIVLHTHLFQSNNGLSPQACQISIPTWTGVMEGPRARLFELDRRSMKIGRQIANTQDVRLNVH